MFTRQFSVMSQIAEGYFARSLCVCYYKTDTWFFTGLITIPRDGSRLPRMRRANCAKDHLSVKMSRGGERRTNARQNQVNDVREQTSWLFIFSLEHFRSSDWKRPGMSGADARKSYVKSTTQQIALWQNVFFSFGGTAAFKCSVY